jgi:hypothetical protein
MDQLVDENGQVYEVTDDTGDSGWLNSVFGAVNTGLSALGSYFNSLPKGQNTLGAGSGQATTTDSSGGMSGMWNNLLAGLQNGFLQLPGVQNVIKSGAQSSAQQTAGAWIMNPITWVIAGIGAIALIIFIARRK